MRNVFNEVYDSALIHFLFSSVSMRAERERERAHGENRLRKIVRSPQIEETAKLLNRYECERSAFTAV